jgi:hypothetical protein
MRILLLTVFLLVFNAQDIQSQVTEEWVARYNSPASYTDGAKALIVDISGNVIVTGYSWNGTSYDYATIKYSSIGNTIWVRKYNGPGNSTDLANALAVDILGNVYITGRSTGSRTGSDYATIKYNSMGDTVWVRRYGGTDIGNDEALALAIDESDNVYITGKILRSGNNWDYGTIKYNSSGDTVWVRRYNGPGNLNNSANAIAVDSSGNVYVTGRSTGSGTGTDFATIKYDRNGDSLWVRRYNGSGNNSDAAQAIVVDDWGNVYVTGRSTGSRTGSDFVTIKYNSMGDTVWVRRYDGPGNNIDAVRALSIDNSGNVYVTGTSFEFGPTYDIITIKYNSKGDTYG